MYPDTWGFYVDADRMAEGLLLPRAADPTRPADLLPDSWARVKAALRASPGKPLE